MTVKKQSLFSQKLSERKKPDHKRDIQKLLDPDSYDDFMAGLQDSSISTAVLAAALEECGYVISPSTLLRWRQLAIKGAKK